MSCEQISRRGNRLTFEPYAFVELHSDGQNLIRGWLDRASALTSEDQVFERFIFAWVAFNAWAECVVPDSKSDHDYLRSLAETPEVAKAFESRVDSRLLKTFAAAWPIFRAQEVVRRSLVSTSKSREERREVLLAKKVEHEPSCWSTHSGKPPSDWRHTLYALYRVRCNLFHGQKSF